MFFFFIIMMMMWGGVPTQIKKNRKIVLKHVQFRKLGGSWTNDDAAIRQYFINAGFNSNDIDVKKFTKSCQVTLTNPSVTPTSDPVVGCRWTKTIVKSSSSNSSAASSSNSSAASSSNSSSNSSAASSSSFSSSSSSKSSNRGYLRYTMTNIKKGGILQDRSSVMNWLNAQEIYKDPSTTNYDIVGHSDNPVVTLFNFHKLDPSGGWTWDRVN